MVLFNLRRQFQFTKYPPKESLLVIGYIVLAVLHAEMYDIAHCGVESSRTIRIGCYPIMTAALYLVWKVSTMDPGKVMKNVSDVSEEAIKYCDICHLSHLQSSGTHHCRECNHCVEGFDHHCVVLGVCIGKLNRLTFIGLVGLGGIGHVALGNISFCRIGDSIWKHYYSYVTLIFHQGIDFHFRNMINLCIKEIWQHFLGLYFTVAAASLLSFFFLHVGMYVSHYSSLDLARQWRRMDRFRYLFGMGRLLRIFVAKVHEICHIDYCMTTSCTSNPNCRWKVLSLISVPYAIFSIINVFTARSFLGMLWFSAIFVFINATNWYMRLVILSLPTIDNQDFLTATEERQFALYNDKKCVECKHSFLLNCHHCPLMGTCIHKDNRTSFMRMCAFCTMATSMFIPVIVNYFAQHFGNEIHQLDGREALMQFVFRHGVSLIGPCIVSMHILGQGGFSLMCYMQEAFYLCNLNIIYHNHLYRQAHHQEPPFRITCPSKFGTLFCRIFFTDDVDHFQNRILNLEWDSVATSGPHQKCHVVKEKSEELQVLSIEDDEAGDFTPLLIRSTV